MNKILVTKCNVTNTWTAMFETERFSVIASSTLSHGDAKMNLIKEYNRLVNSHSGRDLR